MPTQVSLVVVVMMMVALLAGQAAGIHLVGRHDNLIRINLAKQRTSLTRGEAIFGHQFASTDADGATTHLNRINMSKIKGLSFIAEIQVGTPGKLFRVLLDSGSGDLWLANTNCTGLNTTIVATYDQSQSSSHEQDGRPVQFTYASGTSISGHLAREFVQFGDLAVDRQTFIQADNINNPILLEHFGFSGILGLNFLSGSDNRDFETPIERMMRATSQKSPGQSNKLISFSLNHGPDKDKAGEVIIGGLDESKYVGEIAWTPLMRSDHWQFRLDSIELNFLDENKQPTVNNLTVCEHGCEAIADTGATILVGNPKDVQALNDKIGAFHIGNGNYVLRSCKDLDDQLPHLTITISGKKFSLSPSMYTFEEQAICFSAFKWLSQDLHQWVLGNIFLGHFYTILDFDNHRFGLAESAFKTDKNIINN